MLAWSAAFLVIAIVAGTLGFGGLATNASPVAKILFLVFVALSLLCLRVGKRRPS